MVQIRVLAGQQAGSHHLVRQLPALIGRSNSATVHLEDDGVWDEHAEIRLESADGLVLRSFPDAVVSLNGTRIDQARLRNGDVIELGAARLQVWLSEVPQRSLRAREVLTWVALGAICILQVLIVYWLL